MTPFEWFIFLFIGLWVAFGTVLTVAAIYLVIQIARAFVSSGW
jgi:hypothetical protein